MLFIIFLFRSFWYSDASHSPSKNPAVAPTSRDHSQRRYCLQSCVPNFPPIIIVWGISVYSSNLYIPYKHAAHKSASSIPYVTVSLVLFFFISSWFIFPIFFRTHAARRTVDRVPCNLKRVVFESSQERFIRVPIYYNSIYFRESPINVNS